MFVYSISITCVSISIHVVTFKTIILWTFDFPRFFLVDIPIYQVVKEDTEMGLSFLILIDDFLIAQSFLLNPKGGVGGPKWPYGYGYGVYSFNFDQNFSKFFWWKLFDGPRGCWKRSSIFQALHPSKKSMLPKANEQRQKKSICEIFHQKKSESFWWKLKKWWTFF